ncbi:MAG: nucleotidyl transferase AbiEii/AbiGii toxin family protein [Bacilli bacterium]
MNIQDKINTYRDLGLNELDAIAKVCGEIILYKISKTSKARNITVKGGVVMMNMSKDLRRATRDLDLDFIKYSLSEDSIIKFIERLNEIDDDVKLVI